MAFIFKNFDLPPRSISAIDMRYLDLIQDWLNDVGITYTTGVANMAWNEVMKWVRSWVNDGTFYLDVDVDGENKPAGWMFLSMESGDAGEDEEEEDDDSSFAEDSESESESESDSDDDESSYADDSDDDSDEDADDDLSEEGKDWDELERDAARDDKKRAFDRDDDRGGSKKRKK